MAWGQIMNEKTRKALVDDYKRLERLFWDIYDEWGDGYLTTGEAISRQEMLRERMQEIRGLLTADLDEDKAK